MLDDVDMLDDVRACSTALDGMLNGMLDGMLDSMPGSVLAHTQHESSEHQHRHA